MRKYKYIILKLRLGETVEKPQLVNFIAKVLEDSGFKVYKNFKTSQQVVDIYAILQTSMGDFGLVVACKNYDKDWEVGIDDLKEMEVIGKKLNASKVAVVTSSNKAKMSAVKARIPNFEDLFDKVLTAEDFVASKPDPACYLYAAQVFSANKCECVVFEDAVNGLQAGVSAGMFTIGFATTNPRDVIEPLCHHVQDDFLHLSFTDVENMLVNYWTKG